MITELNERSRDIFAKIVDAYIETGAPVGSKTLACQSELGLSAATIRNVMAELEELGLIHAPHTSAGRLPTEIGLRLFVDGLLEVGSIGGDEKKDLEEKCQSHSSSLTDMLENASSALSGLAGCTGLVAAPKTSRALKHIEFVPLNPQRGLVVLVLEGGLVENRVIELPPGLPAGALVTAGNYLNAKLIGKPLAQAHDDIMQEVQTRKSELDTLTKKIVADGLASWAGGEEGERLIIRGQSKLLNDINAIEDLERVRRLFEELEKTENLGKLLETTSAAQGVQIFIGAQSELFSHAGCSMVLSPYTDGHNQVIGAIGVIGPMRLNYARIIPMVDYTAKLIGRNFTG